MTNTFPLALKQWRTLRRVSQLELAVRAGTTQRHISFIESGRSIPGREMVVRLAESLEISMRERNAMLLAAGYAPAYRETSLDAPKLKPVRQALKRVLDGHMPYPAVVIDRFGDLVEANDAFHIMIETAAPELRRPRLNVARIFLHRNGLAPRIENFDIWAWHVIEALRAEQTRNPTDRHGSLIAELEGLLPEHPPQPGPDYLGFAVPLQLRPGMRLLTTLARFGTADDVTVAELRLEAFLPADEQSADILTRLAAKNPQFARQSTT